MCKHICANLSAQYVYLVVCGNVSKYEYRCYNFACKLQLIASATTGNHLPRSLSSSGVSVGVGGFRRRVGHLLHVVHYLSLKNLLQRSAGRGLGKKIILVY